MSIRAPFEHQEPSERPLMAPERPDIQRDPDAQVPSEHRGPSEYQDPLSNGPFLGWRGH